MAIEGIKPLASLDGTMLGRRAPGRRVPLSFAPIEDCTGIERPDADVPEVVRQVERLALALAGDAPADRIDDLSDDAGATRRRIAFTVRLDAARHGQLRRTAAAEGRSAQAVLVDALDLYCARATGAPASSATLPSRRNASTGNQP